MKSFADLVRMYNESKSPVILFELMKTYGICGMLAADARSTVACYCIKSPDAFNDFIADNYRGVPTEDLHLIPNEDSIMDTVFNCIVEYLNGDITIPDKDTLMEFVHWFNIEMIYPDRVEEFIESLYKLAVVRDSGISVDDFIDMVDIMMIRSPMLVHHFISVLSEDRVTLIHALPRLATRVGNLVDIICAISESLKSKVVDSHTDTTTFMYDSSVFNNLRMSMNAMVLETITVMNDDDENELVDIIPVLESLHEHKPILKVLRVEVVRSIWGRLSLRDGIYTNLEDTMTDLAGNRDIFARISAYIHLEERGFFTEQGYSVYIDAMNFDKEEKILEFIRTYEYEDYTVEDINENLSSIKPLGIQLPEDPNGY